MYKYIYIYFYIYSAQARVCVRVRVIVHVRKLKTSNRFCNRHVESLHYRWVKACILTVNFIVLPNITCSSLVLKFCYS